MRVRFQGGVLCVAFYLYLEGPLGGGTFTKKRQKPLNFFSNLFQVSQFSGGEFIVTFFSCSFQINCFDFGEKMFPSCDAFLPNFKVCRLYLVPLRLSDFK